MEERLTMQSEEIVEKEAKIEDLKKKLLTMLSKISVEKEEQAYLVQAQCKTEAVLTATAQEFRLATEQVAAYCERQQHLLSSMREENGKLRQQLDASIGEVQTLSATMATRRADSYKVTDVTTKVANTGTAVMSTIQRYTESLVQSSGDLYSNVAALHQNSAKTVRDCLVRAQEASCNLLDIHKTMEEKISDEVASTSTRFAEQKRVGDEKMAAFTSAVSKAVTAGTFTAEGQAEKEKALACSLDAAVSDTCGELLSICHRGSIETAHALNFSDSLRTDISNNMGKCSYAVSDFIYNDVQEYVPTGLTPQRRDYLFPTELAETSPHERIVSRLRTAVDFNAAADPSFASSVETDATASEAKPHDFSE
ncbi:hypothetical protein HPB50_007020 [Hyalomma asiaticum]|uniref:Uncharacterized protein n=1 Tax=Hyalomma asiaticum TaxID=266040 RepID=A0ACB7TDE0_HYAAI|nr:hypothetical protein HPB50_007020 [Hyalomma asiaticum]